MLSGKSTKKRILPSPNKANQNLSVFCNKAGKGRSAGLAKIFVGLSGSIKGKPRGSFAAAAL